MQEASRIAAEQIRSRLLHDEHAPPEWVRSILNRVPRDDYDAWLDQVLDVEDIPDDGPDLPRGCVPYLPCPVSTVLSVVERARVTSSDVFVDVGSGLGRTLFLAQLLTGAECIGIEIQSLLRRLATERAERFNLTRARFIEADAVELTRVITTGSVFFLYCPFSGERLERFLGELQSIASRSDIRLCCVGMAPLDRPWLSRVGSSDSEFDLYLARR